MRVGSFSVLIPEGRERETGYIELPHGRVYTLRIGNHDHRRCDAEITIDGKSIGAFRINANQNVTLERSADDSGRFTFFKADSGEAASAGIAKIDNVSRGLLQVVFRPERRSPGNVVRTMGMSTTMDCGSGEREDKTSGGLLSAFAPQNCAAGITGLTGHSSQGFTSVSNLDYDPSGETTISLRLVADMGGVRELRESSRANPVPAPVG